MQFDTAIGNNMTYDQFTKLSSALEKYINTNNSIMCSPNKIRKHLIPNLRYESAQNITLHYRLYIKNRYSLNKLILMILLYKYGTNEVFENVVGDKQRVTDMEIKRKKFSYLIPALEKFLMKY